MPLLPSDLPDPQPGDPIRASDTSDLSKPLKFLMDYVADNAVEDPGSQRKRNQNPIIQRIGTISRLEISEGDAPAYVAQGLTVVTVNGDTFADYPDARYFVDISSPLLDLTGTQLLETNNHPEISSSIIQATVTATDLAELPTAVQGSSYQNGYGTHGIAIGTRVWLWGIPVEWNPLVLRWVFCHPLPPVAWIKLTSIIPPASLGSPDGGGGFYNARLMTGSPQTIDPTTDLIIPFSPSEVIPGMDNILAENSLEANLGDPPSHWVPIADFPGPSLGDDHGPIVPAWYVGMSNETTPRPVYRFAYPNPGVTVTVKVTGIRSVSGPPIAGGGRYNCRVLTGRAAGVDPDTDLNLPDAGETVPGADNAIFENECETAFPNSHWVGIPSFIEARFVGYDNENPALPVYRAYIPSPNIPFQIIDYDANAQYQVKTLTGASTQTIGAAFTAPGGMTEAASWNAIASNLDESGLAGNRLKKNSWGLGQVVGATPEGKGVIYFHGGVGTLSSATALAAGGYSEPDTTTWNRDTDGTPVTFDQVLTNFGFDSASKNWWWHYREVQYDARGMIYDVGVEQEATQGTNPCPTP